MITILGGYQGVLFLHVYFVVKNVTPVPEHWVWLQLPLPGGLSASLCLAVSSPIFTRTCSLEFQLCPWLCVSISLKVPEMIILFLNSTLSFWCVLFVLSTVAMQLEWGIGEGTRRVSSQSHLIQRVPVNIHEEPKNWQATVRSKKRRRRGFWPERD